MKPVYNILLLHEPVHSLFFRSRGLFSLSVWTVKLILPTVVFLGFSAIFFFWDKFIFADYVQLFEGNSSSPIWLAAILSLTYSSGILLVAMILFILSRVGLMNFRSGLMDYYGLGFFHWYIFTDIQYGWIQLIMSPLSGTAVYL